MTPAARKKLTLFAMIVALLAVYFGLGLHRSLSLEALTASRDQLAVRYAAAPLPFLAGYFGLYVLVAALSLPGATALTLAGAAVFGFWPTLIVVSFASTLGATAACALCRHLFRDLAARRLGRHLAAIDAGMAREGAFYLFSLRLIPLFPFFVVNAAMGLTAMPLRTFFLVSQIGMLPGTAVYVNAGRELGRLDSPSGILSPGLVTAFVLLGLLPLVSRRLVAVWRAGRKTKPS